MAVIDTNSVSFHGKGMTVQCRPACSMLPHVTVRLVIASFKEGVDFDVIMLKIIIIIYLF